MKQPKQSVDLSEAVRQDGQKQINEESDGNSDKSQENTANESKHADEAPSSESK